MKKTLVAGLVGLLAAASFAGKDNVVITFCSQGPDTYADGSAVLDGETYALVWTPQGATFQGFAADGSAVAPSKVVLKAPLAKDGKCPFVKYEIDEGYAAKENFKGGTWAVYLLDTRVFTGTLDADGKPQATGAFGKAVNGYGEVSTAKTSVGFVSADGAAAVGAGLMPADKGEVKITNIELKDGKVFITVSGTVSSAAYAVAEGETPNAILPTETAAVGNTAGEMILVRDQKAGGAFFKVNRK